MLLLPGRVQKESQVRLGSLTGRVELLKVVRPLVCQSCRDTRRALAREGPLQENQPGRA